MKSGCIHLTNYRATLHNKPPSVCYLFHPGEAVIDYFAAGTLKHLLHSIMRKSILGNSLIEGWGKAVVRPVRRVWLNNDHRRHDIITTMAETVKPRKYDAKEVYKEHNMQKLVLS